MPVSWFVNSVSNSLRQLFVLFSDFLRRFGSLNDLPALLLQALLAQTIVDRSLVGIIQDWNKLHIESYAIVAFKNKYHFQKQVSVSHSIYL